MGKLHPSHDVARVDFGDGEMLHEELCIVAKVDCCIERENLTDGCRVDEGLLTVLD